MDEAEGFVGAFESSRPRLRAVAYRMLGSHPEAEDAVQDVWLRFSATDAARVDNLGGWLTTVTARVCLDRLRSRRSRREEFTDMPFRQDPASSDAHDDPEQQVLIAESIGAALLVVLDSLAPAERVAFVLHDVFAVPFEEIADIVDRSPDATRQLASRARRRVQGSAATVDLDLIRRRRIVDAFLRASRSGDFESLLRLLDPDVVLKPDAAALRMGSLQQTRGAEAVATMLSGGAQTAQLAIIAGMAGLVWAPGGQARGVIEFTVTDDKIVAIDVTGNVERIRQLDIVVLET